MHNRYHLWCIAARRNKGQKQHGKLLLLGLGTREQCRARWADLIADEKKMSIQLWQACKRLKSIKGTSTVHYGSYYFREEAMNVLRNARAQLPYCIVEDWTKS